MPCCSVGQLFNSSDLISSAYHTEENVSQPNLAIGIKHKLVSIYPCMFLCIVRVRRIVEIVFQKFGCISYLGMRNKGYSYDSYHRIFKTELGNLYLFQFLQVNDNMWL